MLHGAVVLITELCERSPETLERFRKVTHTRTPSFSLLSSPEPAYALPLRAVCVSGRSRSDPHHEESGGLGLFSGARRLWSQRPLPAGRWAATLSWRASGPVTPTLFDVVFPCTQVRVLRLLRILGHNNETASDAMNDLLAQVTLKTDDSNRLVRFCGSEIFFS